MDQNRNIEHCEAEYIYTHIGVAHLLFWSIEFSHCHQAAQSAFRASVALVVLEVHLCLCASSESVDSLLCHFAKEDGRLFNFPESLPGVFPSQRSPCYAWETQHPASSLLELWHMVS